LADLQDLGSVGWTTREWNLFTKKASEFDFAAIAGDGLLASQAARDELLGNALDALDGALDDSHPEGDGCQICRAADELRDILDASEKEIR
jgi:hypothetical protein